MNVNFRTRSLLLTFLVASRTTALNSEDGKINDLIVSVKEVQLKDKSQGLMYFQSISSIQNKIMYLQSNNDLIYSKQSEKMSKAILEILNMRAMEIAKEFKNTLERRTRVSTLNIFDPDLIALKQTIKQYKEKESFFSMVGAKSSELKQRKINKNEAAFLKRPNKTYE